MEKVILGLDSLRENSLREQSILKSWGSTGGERELAAPLGVRPKGEEGEESHKKPCLLCSFTKDFF